MTPLLQSKKPSAQFLWLCFFLLMGFVLYFALTLSLSVAGVDLKENATAVSVMLVLSQLLLFLLPALLMASLVWGSFPQSLCLHFSPSHWAKAGMAVLVLLLLLPAIDGLSSWNNAWHLPQSLQGLEVSLREQQAESEGFLLRYLEKSGVGNLLANLFVIALVPAVCEELFFRCTLQQLLQRWFKSPHVAILLAAAVFSLAHGEPFSFMPRFVMGILLGYAFHYSQSLLVNTTVHFLNNATIVLFYYLHSNGIVAINPSEPFGFSLFFIIACLLGAVLLFYDAFLRPRA